MTGFFSRKKGKLRGEEICEITEKSDDIDETRVVGSAISAKRMNIFRGIVFFAFILLVSRVSFLQLIKGGYYSDISRENRVRAIVVKAPRGIIFDRNGEKLVSNIPSFDLVAIPADIPKSGDERRQVIDRAARIIGMNTESLEVMISAQDSNSMNPVLVKENVSEDESLLISENQSSLKGFVLGRTAVRQYQDGSVFSAMIGYSGKISKEELAGIPTIQ